MICGLPFAGKTTLGNTISKYFGCAQVAVDKTKRRIFPNIADGSELSARD
jgi:adenylate kinase family enzyme